MIFPDVVVIWLAVAGGCAVILGARRVGILLVMPAVVRFVLWPNVAPTFDQLLGGPLLLLLPVIAVFAGISFLQSMVRLGYGETAGGYVAGNYLVRVFDFVGWVIFAIVSLPFRIFWRRAGKRTQKGQQ